MDNDTSKFYSYNYNIFLWTNLHNFPFQPLTSLHMNKLSPQLCPCYTWNGDPLVPNGIFKRLAEDNAIKRHTANEWSTRISWK